MKYTARLHFSPDFIVIDFFVLVIINKIVKNGSKIKFTEKKVVRPKTGFEMIV